MSVKNAEPIRPRDEPAYPVMVNAEVCTGMDLSDYFAGQALPGLISEHGGNVSNALEIARLAYTMAEAMLVVREHKNREDE